MDVKIYPSRFVLEDDFYASKTLTHLYLIASFIANQGVILENISLCDDLNATLSFFHAIKKEVLFNDEHSCFIKPSKNQFFEQISIQVNSSTSTLLYLLPMSLHFAKKVIFVCDDDLIHIPLELYQEVSSFCNFSIKSEGNQLICSGNISLDYYEIDGSYSSQYIIGFIFNALYLKKPITIKIKPPFNCKKSILMSIEIFKKFGFDITFNEDCFFIHASFNGNWDFLNIEGDYSVLANYLVLACLNGSLLAHHFNQDSLQSEKQMVDILKKCGGNIRYLKNGEEDDCLYALNNTLIEKGFSKPLKAIEVNLYECFDISLILMVLACFLNGTSKFYNFNLLKYKELFRVNKMLDLLKSLNVTIYHQENSFMIIGKKNYHNEITLPSYHDYKIVMALSVFALLNQGCITILDVNCINKADPLFFKRLIKGCKMGSIQLSEKIG